MHKTMEAVTEKIDDLLSRQKWVVVAIDGSCTAGKSTLAAALGARYGCNVLHMDDFFLRPEQRTPGRLGEAGGNVDYERFLSEVLLPLEEHRPFAYRPYDCGTGMLKPAVQVEPGHLTVIEGTYSQHPYFGDRYDLKIFLQISGQRQAERIALRPAFLHRRFFGEWIPMEKAYFEAFAIGENSDLRLFPEDNR